MIGTVFDVNTLPDTVSVPAHVATAWAITQGVPNDFPLIGFGNRFEVDLTACPPETAVELAQWFDTVKQYWRTGGPDHTPPGLITERIIASYREQHTDDRTTLSEVLAVLTGLPEFGPLIHQLTSADPDFEDLTTQVVSRGGALHRNGTRTTVSIPIPTTQVWPASLGGMPTIGQVQRRLTCEINHAAWRQRRARRLTSVEVVVTDAWPQPA